MSSKRVAVVTGGNRGIGNEICRQLGEQGFRVVLTARSAEKGEPAAEALRKEGHDVSFLPLDVTSEQSIGEFAKALMEKFGRVDALINNAGVFLEKGHSPLEVPLDIVRATMETNAFGALRLSQELIPLMKKAGYGRIVNVSSSMGSLSQGGAGNLCYRISKTTLNGITSVLAAELAESGILVNCMCPGWVKTDMGGASAPRSPREGADTAVWLALLPNDGPTGKFFLDRQVIAW